MMAGMMQVTVFKVMDHACKVFVPQECNYNPMLSILSMDTAMVGSFDTLTLPQSSTRLYARGTFSLMVPSLDGTRVEVSESTLASAGGKVRSTLSALTPADSVSSEP
jgi:hypothetical protein